MIIGVFSGLEGSGKTTVAANLGAVLSTFYSLKVVVVDASFIAPTLAEGFGIREPPTSITDVLRSPKLGVEKATYVTSEGVRIVPCEQAEPSKQLLSRMGTVISSLNKAYDCVIVDAAPGVSLPASSVMRLADRALIISTSEKQSIAAAKNVAKLAEKCKTSVLGLVINRREDHAHHELAPAEAGVVSGLRVILVIPEDERVLEASAAGKPVVFRFPASRASRCFHALARHLHDEECVFKPARAKPAGIIDRLRKRPKAA
ncbi:P-loop NTPase [Candidatus Micrarchaeota archaeon]|nr:P-loop NTPase [Candidatus Micrarchaeota archaeon]